MSEHQICERCREGTKRPTGFWDGKDEAGRDISGLTYSCENAICKIAVKKRREADAAEQKRAEADEANSGQGIDPEQFVAARRRAGLTLYKAAQLADISPATLSAYENRRLPFPALVYNRLMALFDQTPPREGAP